MEVFGRSTLKYFHILFINLEFKEFISFLILPKSSIVYANFLRIPFYKTFLEVPIEILSNFLLSI